ncbi:hypothetical protein ACOME3_008845, partial [Neoechinorhynchus agilis]
CIINVKGEKRAQVLRTIWKKLGEPRLKDIPTIRAFSGTNIDTLEDVQVTFGRPMIYLKVIVIIVMER